VLEEEPEQKSGRRNPQRAASRICFFQSDFHQTPTTSFTMMQLFARALRCVALAGGLMLCAAATDAVAQGNLLISPRRVVFDGSRRTQELNLANTGTDTARFLISVLEIRMKEDGAFEVIDETDTSSVAGYASPHIRFFPRSVTLAPNEAQTVKVQMTRAGDLPPGEYRSHLYFRAAQQETPAGTPSADTGGVKVSLTPIFGISIPVIIRAGAQEAEAGLADVTVNRSGSKPAIDLVFTRAGGASVYGDLVVSHISPAGVETQVGIAKGIAVYTSVARRKFRLELEGASAVDMSAGKLRLRYLDQAPGQNQLAEATINL